MQRDYIDPDGRSMIRKRTRSHPEYWYDGKKMMRGPEVCGDADPESPPTSADWRFCATQRDKYLAEKE